MALGRFSGEPVSDDLHCFLVEHYAERALWRGAAQSRPPSSHLAYERPAPASVDSHVYKSFRAPTSSVKSSGVLLIRQATINTQVVATLSKGSSVSAGTLAYGLWYAIEQCGCLLSDAVQLYEKARFPTTIALTLLANEEFGKSRNLLALWDQAEKGNSITAADVENAVHPKKNVHQKKQAAALVSLTAGVARGTETVTTGSSSCATGIGANIFNRDCRRFIPRRCGTRDSAPPPSRTPPAARHG